MEEKSHRLVALAHWLDGKLTPDEARKAEMLRRAQGLAMGLRDRSQPPIRVVEFDFFGSLIKQTAVEPCEDVDVLLVLDPDVLATQRGTQRTPMSTVTELRREVTVDIGPGWWPRVTSRWTPSGIAWGCAILPAISRSILSRS